MRKLATPGPGSGPGSRLAVSVSGVQAGDSQLPAFIQSCPARAAIFFHKGNKRGTPSVGPSHHNQARILKLNLIMESFQLLPDPDRERHCGPDPTAVPQGVFEKDSARSVLKIHDDGHSA